MEFGISLSVGTAAQRPCIAALTGVSEHCDGWLESFAAAWDHRFSVEHRLVIGAWE